MFNNNMNDDEKYTKQIRLTIVIFIIVTILLLIISIIGVYNYISSDKKVTPNIPVEEKTIAKEDYGYSFTAPLITNVATYEVGKDLNPGIYDIFYSESSKGNGAITVHKKIKLENCAENCTSEIIYIYPEETNHGQIYDNLVLEDGDSFSVNLDGSGKFEFKTQDEISKLSEQDGTISGTFQVDSGNYRLKVSNVKHLIEPENLYIESYEGNSVHRYYVELRSTKLFFVHDLIDGETGEVTLIYETEFTNDLQADIPLSEQNYIYYDADEMQGKYDLIKIG